jgi:hypothetical protein
MSEKGWVDGIFFDIFILARIPRQCNSKRAPITDL